MGFYCIIERWRLKEIEMACLIVLEERTIERNHEEREGN